MRKKPRSRLMALTATLQKESNPEEWYKIMLKVMCPQ
jgi:hypothetical protein